MRGMSRKKNWKKAYVTIATGKSSTTWWRNKGLGMAVVRQNQLRRRRFVVKVVDSELHKGAPHKALISPQKKSGGRNNAGRITTRHRGGGHKQHYRVIDWKRSKDGIPAVIERLEYDPNRTANIALLKYADGERRYIIAPKGVHAGDPIMSGPSSPIKPGNALAIRNIPVGSVIHCVELKPGKGAQMVRSAGGSCQLVAREGRYATLRMRSGEMRGTSVPCDSCEVGNSEHNLRSWVRPVRRLARRRPTVRGVAEPSRSPTWW